MEACHGWVSESERRGSKWYEGGCTYCPKCTVRFTEDKFIIMNTEVKRCICCHERLRLKPKIHRVTKNHINAVYI